MEERYWILQDRIPVETDRDSWQNWMEAQAAHTVVRVSTIGNCHWEAPQGVQPCMVSTAFTGLDHSKGAEPQPLLFETVVRGTRLNGTVQHYASWQEAEEGHEELLRKI